MADRFLTREKVAVELNISKAQTYALIRRGNLPAIKIDGRGVYRVVARVDLEAYIAAGSDETSRWIREHPFDEEVEPDGEG